MLSVAGCDANDRFVLRMLPSTGWYAHGIRCIRSVHRRTRGSFTGTCAVEGGPSLRIGGIGVDEAAGRPQLLVDGRGFGGVRVSRGWLIKVEQGTSSR